MRFLRIKRDDLPKWQSELDALEHRSVYPLGGDAFRISHGADTFAFFERMGRVFYYAMEDRGRLVAVGCGVLRDNPRRWYASDLKVHPDYRGQHLPVALLRRAFFQNYIRCPRGYGVAMDPTDGRPPPSYRLLKHFRWLPFSLFATTPLCIFSADAETMRRATPILEAARGQLHFVSLHGIKDLVLESTHAPMPLLHVDFGSPRERTTFSTPQLGHTHMWCAPRTDALCSALARVGIHPSATATIIHHNLSRFDWSTLLTSEI